VRPIGQQCEAALESEKEQKKKETKLELAALTDKWREKFHSCALVDCEKLLRYEELTSQYQAHLDSMNTTAAEEVKSQRDAIGYTPSESTSAIIQRMESVSSGLSQVYKGLCAQEDNIEVIELNIKCRELVKEKLAILKPSLEAGPEIQDKRFFIPAEISEHHGNSIRKSIVELPLRRGRRTVAVSYATSRRQQDFPGTGPGMIIAADVINLLDENKISTSSGLHVEGGENWKQFLLFLEACNFNFSIFNNKS
jgi:hypothetical protein